MAQSTQHDRYWVKSNLTYTIDPSMDGWRGSVDQAIAAWTNVSPFNLVYAGTSGGDIHIRDVINPAGGYSGRATTTFDANAVIQNVQVELSGATSNVYLALHELGHALGQIQDNQGITQNETIYTSVLNSDGYLNPDGSLPTAPRGGDIQAIQSRYGASSGNNLINAGEGGHIISGGDGYDTIYGENGDDIIYGNKNLDALYGNAGNDTIYAGQNDGVPSGDPLAMRDGVEFIWGGSGDDVLYGNHGADVLEGNNDNDILYGGQDSDTLSGGAGSDTIFGNRGDDHMWGGSGADIFGTSGDGNDVVHDFNVAEGDRIDVLNPATVTIGNNGGLAIFQYETGSITLVGVAPDQALAGWLI
ncbi:MAG: hypothetical protein NXI19_04665 [Alphaproteobacteria bacterium]|nr:hypothetical protein [Alphaproteobacteria bacterium]